jgi:hypothetical protein
VLKDEKEDKIKALCLVVVVVDPEGVSTSISVGDNSIVVGPSVAFGCVSSVWHVLGTGVSLALLR